MGIRVGTEAGLVSRNAINGGKRGKRKRERMEKVVGVDRDARKGESVFVTCVLSFFLNAIYT